MRRGVWMESDIGVYRMNESCRPGMEYLIQLHEEEQNCIETALVREVSHANALDGMSGEEMPYQLRSDWMVTAVLFLCFILVSYVFARGKKHLEQQLKNFSLLKDRANLFDDTVASDVRYTLVLVLQTCILSGFCIYDYFSDHDLVLFRLVPHYLLLSAFIGCIVCFLLLKWLAYNFINWIFFNKTQRMIWVESYANVIIWVGFLLFPVVLLIVYFDLSPQISYYIIGFVIIIAKILLLYKCINNFFNRIHGFFHLILYFCALEILPDFALWKGIVLANNIFVLNF